VLIIDDGGGVERFVWLPADESATEPKAAHALALLDTSSSTTARTVVVTAGTEPVRLLFNLPKHHDIEAVEPATETKTASATSMQAVLSVMDTPQPEDNRPAKPVPSTDYPENNSTPVLLSYAGTPSSLLSFGRGSARFFSACHRSINLLLVAVVSQQNRRPLYTLFCLPKLQRLF
jgi:hypothetical protein